MIYSMGLTTKEVWLDNGDVYDLHTFLKHDSIIHDITSTGEVNWYDITFPTNETERVEKHIRMIEATR